MLKSYPADKTAFSVEIIIQDPAAEDLLFSKIDQVIKKLFADGIIFCDGDILPIILDILDMYEYGIVVFSTGN